MDNNQAAKAKDFRNGRACKRNPKVDKAKGHKNRNKAKIRARVEHVLGVVQRLWGFNKAHDRRPAKNTKRVLSVLTNLFMNRKRLTNERPEEKANWHKNTVHEVQKPYYEIEVVGFDAIAKNVRLFSFALARLQQCHQAMSMAWIAYCPLRRSAK